MTCKESLVRNKTLLNVFGSRGTNIDNPYPLTAHLKSKAIILLMNDLEYVNQDSRLSTAQYISSYIPASYKLFTFQRG